MKSYVMQTITDILALIACTFSKIVQKKKLFLLKIDMQNW